MSFQFREARREDTRLLIGLAGGTGSGKTESAMRIATGLAGDRPFAVIDTESGRALHKADDYKFQHGDLAAPFTPERYWEAITAADAEGFPVIVIDSFSHVWEGVGGVLDLQAEELERLGGGQNMAPKSWIKPKGRHRRLVNQMLQVRAHLIVCMRAQDKIEIAKEGGKTVVRPAQSLIGAEGWVPICERRFPHELTLSLLLLQDAPGVPKPIKLERRHASLIPLDKPLDEAVGEGLALWAAGWSLTEGEGSEGARPTETGPTEPVASPSASDPQKKKLNVLVGQLRDAGHIRTEQLYTAILRQPVPGEDGEIHWSPLRDSLSKDEAGQLIERLERFQENVRAAESEGEGVEQGMGGQLGPEPSEPHPSPPVAPGAASPSESAELSFFDRFADKGTG